jgi:protoporphyrin/coproporphyrin ferrochelatase
VGSSSPLALLLLAYGGPERLEGVPAFLERVLGAKRVTPALIERACARYGAIGGGSPLVANTQAQADALATRLRESDDAAGDEDIAVFLGMRHSPPFMKEGLGQALDFGDGRVLAFIMASHQSGIATGGYLEDLAQAARELEAEGKGRGTVEIFGPWHAHALYLDAVTARARDAMEAASFSAVRSPFVLFSAHSLPLADGESGEPAYEDALRETAEGVMSRLGDLPWRLAYQSRSPRPGVRWLGPEVGQVLDEEAAAGRDSVLVVPLGFVVEHLETLYDLDIELKARAEGLGLLYRRAMTVQDHPSFIEMMAVLAADLRPVEPLETGR